MHRCEARSRGRPTSGCRRGRSRKSSAATASSGATRTSTARRRRWRGRASRGSSARAPPHVDRAEAAAGGRLPRRRAGDSRATTTSPCAWPGWTAPSPYWFRNADARRGPLRPPATGTLETDFGPLDYEPGDYLVIPRGTVHRLVPNDAHRALLVESRGEVRLPDKGLLGQPRALRPGGASTCPSRPRRRSEPGRPSTRCAFSGRAGSATRLLPVPPHQRPSAGRAT